MKRIHYISPSLLPSKTANSIHVVLQCEALADLGYEVVLYAKRKSPNKEIAIDQVKHTYGVDFSISNVKLVSCYFRYDIASTLLIALLALKHIICLNLRKKNVKYIISRNLYACYILGIILKMPLIFETHQLEYGFRKKMQEALLKASWIKKIAISQRLIKYLQLHHKGRIHNNLVLHDAAKIVAAPDLSEKIKKERLFQYPSEIDFDEWDATVGYFGHVYKGRGIKIIEQMAEKRPKILFLVVGGNNEDVRRRRKSVKAKNVCFIGYISYPKANSLMKLVDVLLMPYQKNVSIGVARHDTAKWMSPMKMFEYMASGVPLIASKLPVLCEVLENEKNALLVPSDHVQSWVSALDRLLEDPNLYKIISERAKSDFKNKHTWEKRAELIVKAFQQF